MILSEPDACVDAVIERIGKTIVIGIPIGLGKPAHLVNALYRRALADSSFRLKLVTGLSIGRPRGNSDIEKRFLEPIVERLFGDSPELDFVGPYSRNALPDNVEVVEFYMKAGSFINNPAAQQHYISTNYTHIGRDMLLQGVNVFAQAVAKRGEGGAATYSLSSNSDSLSLFPGLREAQAAGRPMLIIAQVNRSLPYMPRDAEVTGATFDVILDEPQFDHSPFAVPSPPVNTVDHMIGLYASTLIRDGGTIQIGIGSLGDAIAAACGLRHKDNAVYESILERLGIAERCWEVIEDAGGKGPFERGLYGSTEMFADCFRSLYQHGILSREVFDDPEIQRLANDHDLTSGNAAQAFELLLETGIVSSPLDHAGLDFLERTGVFIDGLGLQDGLIRLPNGRTISPELSGPSARAQVHAHCLSPRLKNATVLHAGFFLGPRVMYDMLNGLEPDDLDKFCMTGIGYVNQLYGNEPIASLQRRDARFINTAMMVTLTGAACSDGLESGQVVSGVGGQYNFVAMAHALAGARSVLMLRSTRSKGETVSSNIVWNYAHTTIPRHLRDIVVTEYGIADLRGCQDHEVIGRLLQIADSRFQGELLKKAVAAGKLPADYRIPDAFCNNTPQMLEAGLKPFRAGGLFGPFPIGTELTDEELVLGKLLKALKVKMGRLGGMAGLLGAAVKLGPDLPAAAAPYLARLGLDKPTDLRETMLGRLIAAELEDGGYL